MTVPLRNFAQHCCACWLDARCGANALDWPTRSVQVIVPIAAGGNTDMMARIGARDCRKFNKPFVVENRSSAGGAVGVSQVARSSPTATRCCSPPRRWPI